MYNPLDYPYVWTGYITAFVTILVGLFVYLNKRNSSVHKSFLFFTLSIAQWGSFSALHAMIVDPGWALFWGKCCHIGVMGIPVFFYYFTLKITGRNRPRMIKAGAVIAVVLITLVFLTPWFVPTTRQDVGVPHLVKGGPLYCLLIIFFGVFVFLAIKELWDEIQIEKYKARKKHLLYFFIASILGFGIGSFNFSPVYGIRIWPFPYSAACGAIYAIVIAYAIQMHRLFDLKSILQRTSIYLFAITIVSLTTWVAVRILSSFTSDLSLEILSLVSIVFAMLAYSRLNKWLSKKFLRRKIISHTKLTHNLINKLEMTHTEQQISDEIVDFFTTAMVDWASFYLKAPKDNRFELRASTWKEERRKRNAPLPSGVAADRRKKRIDHDDEIPLSELDEKNLILDLIKDRKNLNTPLYLSPFDMDSADFRGLKAKLREKRIEAIVPLIIDNNLYGVLLLGRKKSDQVFSLEDKELLRGVIEQVGSFLKSASMLKEATYSYLEVGRRVKMAAIMNLARGVHHEVRNPLHAIILIAQTVLKNIQENQYQNDSLEKQMKSVDNILEKADFIHTEAKRIQQSLDRFAQFSLPGEDETLELANLSLYEEVEGFLSLMKEGRKLKRIKINKNIPKNISVFADKRLLQDIFFHLFNNAYQAMEGSGELFITAENEDTHVIIKIRDTGSGISEEVLPAIFARYFTTKESSGATGIGLSVVKHYVETLNGSIEPTIPKLDGAEFTLKLPKKSIGESRAYAA